MELFFFFFFFAKKKKSGNEKPDPLGHAHSILKLLIVVVKK